MSNKARRMLVLLLIILKEAGLTAAHNCNCGATTLQCSCYHGGLTSVPQDLPTDITRLIMHYNTITTLRQSDFSRYRSLTRLRIGDNQISIIHYNTFHGLTSLTELGLNNNYLTNLTASIFEGLGNLQYLYLYNNQLTSLPADIFEGLGNLEWLNLGSNNIHSIKAGTFIHTTKLRRLSLQHNNISTITAETFGNLLQLETLELSHNNISTFPVEALSNLKMLSELSLDSNQLESLPVMAYDILANISTINIDINPWQCDCRMAPFRQRMNGSNSFEKQIRCAGPANLTGQYLQYLIPEDLICEETTPVYPTSSIVLSVPILATLGAILGLLLICTIGFAVGCMYKRRQRDPPQQGFSNTNPTGTPSGHDQIRLQAVCTSAEVNSQSETYHSDIEDSQHIYDDPMYEDPDVSAGPQNVVYGYENEDEIKSTKEGPQSHKYKNSHVAAAAAKDAAAGPQHVEYEYENAAADPQDVEYGNDDEAARLITLASGSQID